MVAPVGFCMRATPATEVLAFKAVLCKFAACARAIGVQWESVFREHSAVEAFTCGIEPGKRCQAMECVAMSLKTRLRPRCITSCCADHARLQSYVRVWLRAFFAHKRCLCAPTKPLVTNDVVGSLPIKHASCQRSHRGCGQSHAAPSLMRAWLWLALAPPLAHALAALKTQKTASYEDTWQATWRSPKFWDAFAQSTPDLARPNSRASASSARI